MFIGYNITWESREEYFDNFVVLCVQYKNKQTFSTNSKAYINISAFYSTGFNTILQTI